MQAFKATLLFALLLVLVNLVVMLALSRRNTFDVDPNGRQRHSAVVDARFAGKHAEWELGPTILSGNIYGPFNQIMTYSKTLAHAIAYDIPMVLPPVFPHYTMRGNARYTLDPDDWLDTQRFQHPVVHSQTLPPVHNVTVFYPRRRSVYLDHVLKYHSAHNPALFANATIKKRPCRLLERDLEKRRFQMAINFCFSNNYNPKALFKRRHNAAGLLRYTHDFGIALQTPGINGGTGDVALSAYKEDALERRPYVAFHVRMPDRSTFGQNQTTVFHIKKGTGSKGGMTLDVDTFVRVVEHFMDRVDASAYFIATNRKALLDTVQPKINGTLIRKPSQLEDGGVRDVVSDALMCARSVLFVGVRDSSISQTVRQLRPANTAHVEWSVGLVRRFELAAGETKENKTKLFDG